jgi:hypothetical protein
MNAYFSSKMINRLHSAFTMGLLVFCLLGTHWIGLTHAVSHAQSNQVADQSASEHSSLLEHGSVSCHLFDALSLAGFIPPNINLIVAHIGFDQIFFRNDHSVLTTHSPVVYQSRAPPTFII